MISKQYDLHTWPPKLNITMLAEIAREYGTGVWVDGMPVDALEEAWRDHYGVSNATAASSGTAALYLALVGLGVGPGDRVVVPALTFSGSVYAILMAGAEPIFVDVDPSTYCADIRVMAEAARFHHARAVMPVHLHGYPIDIDRLRELLNGDGHRIKIIEDACQAHGTLLSGGYMAGTRGDAGAWSFNATKMVPGGEGGMVVFAEEDRARVARMARIFGEDTEGGEDGRDYLSHISTAGNYRMEHPAAIIARHHLARLDHHTMQAYGNASALWSALEDPPIVFRPKWRAGHSWQKFRIRFPSAEHRERAQKLCEAHGLPVVRWQHAALPDHPAFVRFALRYDTGGFPVARAIMDDSLVLFTERYPIWNQDKDTVSEVAAAFASVFEGVE